jgi:putative FmdB family regulatory protein
MPTYDYKCETCDSVFEHFQSMKEEPLKECLCQKKGKVERLISNGTGIIFRGTGFYVTDYKKTPTESTKSTSES